MEAMLDQIQDTLDMEAILKGLIILINIQRELEGHLGYVTSYFWSSMLGNFKHVSIFDHNHV